MKFSIEKYKNRDKTKYWLKINKFNGYKIVNGVKKSFSFDSIDVNNNQDQLTLEEWLAEEFRAYARNRSKYNNKPKSKIAQFFEMLLEKVRSLFGNHTYSEVVLFPVQKFTPQNILC